MTFALRCAFEQQYIRPEGLFWRGITAPREKVPQPLCIVAQTHAKTDDQPNAGGKSGCPRSPEVAPEVDDVSPEVVVNLAADLAVCESSAYVVDRAVFVVFHWRVCRSAFVSFASVLSSVVRGAPKNAVASAPRWRPLRAQNSKDIT